MQMFAHCEPQEKLAGWRDANQLPSYKTTKLRSEVKLPKHALTVALGRVPRTYLFSEIWAFN